MELYIVDAFTKQRFSGNQAGVALLSHNEEFPTDIFMKSLAKELKHSETVFCKRLNDTTFHARFFTPTTEVDLCGHATIALFTLLREKNKISIGEYFLVTLAGTLSIMVTEIAVWMDMAPPVSLRTFNEEEFMPFYEAYGLTRGDFPTDLVPQIISTGLRDIMLPVKDKETLQRAKQNRQQVMELSKKYDVIGFHLFCPPKQVGEPVHCRNFAPLYDIDEEAATGTSNGALTYYLHSYNYVAIGQEVTFLQGETMGSPSEILSKLSVCKGILNIKIGGSAVISLSVILE